MIVHIYLLDLKGKQMWNLFRSNKLMWITNKSLCEKGIKKMVDSVVNVRQLTSNSHIISFREQGICFLVG